MVQHSYIKSYNASWMLHTAWILTSFSNTTVGAGLYALRRTDQAIPVQRSVVQPISQPAAAVAISTSCSSELIVTVRKCNELCYIESYGLATVL